jgi:DNA-binding GntR family transcriptional regulator
MHKSAATAVKPAGAAANGAADRTQGKPRSLTQVAYELIEEMIVMLELPPGTVISEGELSARLRIGRTPVREALHRLAREHLVTVLPKRGIMVSDIDIKRQLRLLETRREVERLVARSAARRATEEERSRFEHLADEFHAASRAGDETRFLRADKEFNDLSLRAARNEFAAGSMGLMHGLSRRFWYLHYRQANDTALMARLHGELAHAIALRDETLAAQALETLIDHNEAFTRATISTDF